MRKLIGRGWQAKVYLEEGIVIKVYPKDFPVERVELEKDIMRLVRERTSIRIPTLYECSHPKEVKMSFGGKDSFGSLMKTKNKSMREFVEIQSHSHSFEIPELPDVAIRLTQLVENSKVLLPQEKTILLRRLERIAHANTVCHMDFHPGNIMVDASGQSTIIDWVLAGKGNPVYDYANTYTIFTRISQKMADEYFSEIQSRERISTEEVRLLFPVLLTQIAQWETDEVPLKKLHQEIQSLLSADISQ